jgi:peptidoglycan/xylan/chitin deacetylase (PgdA/CDA1 family)
LRYPEVGACHPDIDYLRFGMKIVLSFDYELFFGTDAGSVYKCMLEPTDRLLDLAERFQIPMVFFVDAGFLVKLDDCRAAFPELEKDAQAIHDQLKRMISLGCAVELHVHPHWEKSSYQNGKWKVQTDGFYKLTDFSKEEAASIIRRYSDTLTHWTGQRQKVFRAGGWCIQPVDHISEVLADVGIKVDSSVFPGGRFESLHYDFDFTDIAPYSRTYSFTSNVCIPEETGAFTEVPISSWRFSPLFYWRLYISGRMNKARHRMWGDGNFLAQPGRKKSVLMNFTWNHVSCDGFYAGMLLRQADFYRSLDQVPFVVIGHPKGLSVYALEKLEEFIRLTYKNDEFTTFQPWS